MSKCYFTECKSESCCAVTLNVPAMDTPIDTHRPFEIVFGLEVCLHCFKDLKVAEFINHDIRKMVFQGINECISPKKNYRPAAPDFDRAFLGRLPLDSEKYQKFKVQIEGQINSAETRMQL